MRMHTGKVSLKSRKNYYHSRAHFILAMNAFGLLELKIGSPY